MPELYIPTPQDNITPAMNLYKLMQQKKEYELDLQKQGSLQDYHKQLGQQSKMQNIIALAKDQPEAATQLFNNDPELVQANKGQQVKFLPEQSDADWNVFETGDTLSKINKKTGEVENTGLPAKTKETKTQRTLYQDAEGNYKYGLMDEKGNIVKELGDAPEKDIKNAQGTTVNVDAGGKSFNQELGKSSVEIMKEDRKTAMDAGSGINSINEAKKQLDAGIYSGAGANIKLKFDKWLQFGGIEVGGQKVENTEAYAAATGALVGKIIKQFGAGTGLSDADREYAQKISAGEITLNEDSMRKILDISERAFKAQIKFYNKGIQKMKQSNPESFKSVPFEWEVDEPAIYQKEQGGSMPSGIPQGSKQIGTKNGKPVYQSPDGKKWVVE